MLHIPLIQPRWRHEITRVESKRGGGAYPSDRDICVLGVDLPSVEVL